MGTVNIDISLDSKNYRNKGFTITPERISKLQPKNEAKLKV